MTNLSLESAERLAQQVIDNITPEAAERLGLDYSRYERHQTCPISCVQAFQMIQDAMPAVNAKEGVST